MALRKNHLLFCYLHLAPEPKLTKKLLDIGLTGIAFESVEEADGSLPLLAPMSIIAGRIAVQIGTHLLHQPAGGKGKLSKFKFEWDASEDTTTLEQEEEGVLKTKYEAKPKAEDRMMRVADARAGTAIAGKATDWRSKSEAEMTDRDWQIVREHPLT